jgi:hypothetical protein
MKHNRWNETICVNRFDTVRIIPHKARLFLFLEKHDTDFIYLIRLENNDEFFSCILNKPVFVKDRVDCEYINDTPRLVRYQRISCHYEEQKYVEDNLYNCITHIEGVFHYSAKINKNTLQKDTPGTYLSTHNCSVIYQNNIGQILVNVVYESLFESISSSIFYPQEYDRNIDAMFEVNKPLIDDMLGVYIEKPIKPQFMTVYPAMEHYHDTFIVQPNF